MAERSLQDSSLRVNHSHSAALVPTFDSDVISSSSSSIFSVMRVAQCDMVYMPVLYHSAVAAMHDQYVCMRIYSAATSALFAAPCVHSTCKADQQCCGCYTANNAALVAVLAQYNIACISLIRCAYRQLRDRVYDALWKAWSARIY
jgi:hypothetical protein